MSGERLISVDIEASGPSPSTGSLLSIGACPVDDPSEGLYLELRPLPGRPWDEDAEAIHHLPRERLEIEGLEPAAAMQRLADWLGEVCGNRQPVFVGFNSPFDWMFVADYCWRFLGHNPFGISALDLKSYFMGREGIDRWEQTRRIHVDRRYELEADHDHHALDDARGQAHLAQVLMRRT